jgi:membrane glycosyltransferase
MEWRTSSDPAAAPPTSIESRLSMPAQNLHLISAMAQPSALLGAPRGLRDLTFGAVTPRLWRLRDGGGHRRRRGDDIEVALLGLFVLNFRSRCPSRAASLLRLLMRQRRLRSADGAAETIAVVMPIYNEADDSRPQTIYEDASDRLAHFDWFFLSDTTNPDIGRRRAPSSAFAAGWGYIRDPFHRRREKNTDARQ